MIAFLGKESNKMTNILVNLSYDYVSKNPQDYVIFIMNNVENLNGLLFENEFINQDFLCSIYIKYIMHFDDLINFLTGLTEISEINLPSKVVIDHLDSILNLPQSKCSSTVLLEKMMKLKTIFDLFECLNTKIEFIIKYSLNIMDENTQKENITLYDLFNLYFNNNVYFIDKDTQNSNKMVIYKKIKLTAFDNKYGFDIKLQNLKDMKTKDRDELDRKLVSIEEKINILCLKNINI